MAQRYKTLKEDFVSNLSGSSVSEVNYVTAIAPVSANGLGALEWMLTANFQAAYLLWSALQSRQHFFDEYGPAAYLTDFSLNVVAFLFATTIYSSNLLFLHILLISPAIILYILPPLSASQRKIVRRPSTHASEKREDGEVNLVQLPIRPFITAYRGTMVMSTCVAILAVDFRVFPRRFAKVETWGTSLMDMGVGSFVFSAGLVSARPPLLARLAGKPSSLEKCLKSAFRSSAPLLILGMIRLYSVKGLDYAEHVTEYGVHWNFFFTLALLPPFVALFQSFSTMMPYTALLSLFVSSLYQVLLEFSKLKTYILTSPRLDLLSQNREGVFSFIGYLAIFLTGQAVGFDILPRNLRGASSTWSASTQRRALLLRLLTWTTVWSLSFAATTSFKFGLNLHVSRRIANQPYVFWVSAFNCAQITLFCLIETVSFPGVYKAAEKGIEDKECARATSRILYSLNRNGLAIFLLANLLTGLVNLTLDTLNMSHSAAMGVLITYTSLVTAVALMLDRWNLSIKL